MNRYAKWCNRPSAEYNMRLTQWTRKLCVVVEGTRKGRWVTQPYAIMLYKRHERHTQYTKENTL